MNIKLMTGENTGLLLKIHLAHKCPSEKEIHFWNGILTPPYVNLNP